MRLARRDSRSRKNEYAVSRERSPTHHVSIILESLSSAVHVHVSPAPSGALLACFTFLAFAYVNDQISSHCTRFAATLRTFSSWKVAHAVPASTSSLLTVLIDAPVIREIE